MGGTKPTHNEQNRGEGKGLSQFPLHSLSHPSLWELYFWSSGGCMGKGGNLRPQPVAYCIIYLGEGKGFLPRREEMFLLFLLCVCNTVVLSGGPSYLLFRKGFLRVILHSNKQIFPKTKRKKSILKTLLCFPCCVWVFFGDRISAEVQRQLLFRPSLGDFFGHTVTV